MKNQRGFVGVWVLIAIVLGLIVVGGGTYYIVQQQSPSQTTSENSDNVQTLPTTNNQTQTTETTANTAAQTSQNTTNTKPSITVTAWHSDGPATISVSYSNLPKKTSALALCMDNGACTDWVENFTPPSPSGTYTMSVQHGYADSQKGLGAGKYKIVVIGSEFGDQIVASNVFTVQTQNATSGEAKYPYYIIHAGKTVFTSTVSLSKETATAECIQKISLYTDNGSSSCYWKPTPFITTHELLYEVKSKGADLAVKNVSVQSALLNRNATQRVHFEVANIGNQNNSASASQFGYNVSIEAVNENGSHTPLGNTVKGSQNVPASGASVGIDVDLPASAGQSYTQFRAYIFVNPDRAVDEQQDSDANNATNSPTWTVTN